MCAWQKSKTKPWLRLVALCTALVFTSTSVLWADGSGPAASSLFAEKKLEALPSAKEALTPSNFLKEISLPTSLGQIKSNFQGTRDKIFIHVQDAHVNEEAQRNIAKILDHFATNYGLRLIHIEGAEGELATEIFSKFPSQEARKLSADYFLSLARLTGPEYLAIVQRPELRLFGVEDREIYNLNRQAYLEAVDFKAESESVLAELEKTINDLSRFVFSDELRELRRRRLRFEEGGREMSDYVRSLFEVARKHNLALYDYPGMHSLIALIDLESKINFEKAEAEIDNLTSDLKKVISRERLSRFLTNTVQFRMKKMTRAQYYGFLEEEIRVAPAAGNLEKGTEALSLEAKYKNVLAYLKYTQLYDAIGIGIFDEMQALESAIKNKLFRNDEEVQLDRVSRIHEIFQKMFDFQLTKQDADFFYAYRDEFKSETFAGLFTPLLEKYNFSYGLPEKLAVLDRDLPRVERFYAAALRRDRVLIETAVRKSEADGVSVAAIVTGGFHTPGMEKYLREQDYSYLVITPRIETAINEEAESRLYDDAMRQKPVGIETLLAEAYFPPKSPMLNDPRFQLIPWHMTPAHSEVAKLLSGTDGFKTARSFYISLGILSLLQNQNQASSRKMYRDILRESEKLFPGKQEALRAFIRGQFEGVLEVRRGGSKVLWQNDARNPQRITAWVLYRPTDLKTGKQIEVNDLLTRAQQDERRSVLKLSDGSMLLRVSLDRDQINIPSKVQEGFAGLSQEKEIPAAEQAVPAPEKIVAPTPSPAPAPVSPAVLAARSEVRQTSNRVISAISKQPLTQPIGYLYVKREYERNAKPILEDVKLTPSEKSLRLKKLFEGVSVKYDLAKKAPKTLDPNGSPENSLVILYQKDLISIEINDYYRRLKAIHDRLAIGKMGMGELRNLEAIYRNLSNEFEAFMPSQNSTLSKLSLERSISQMLLLKFSVIDGIRSARHFAWFFSILHFIQSFVIKLITGRTADRSRKTESDRRWSQANPYYDYFYPLSLLPKETVPQAGIIEVNRFREGPQSNGPADQIVFKGINGAELSGESDSVKSNKILSAYKEKRRELLTPGEGKKGFSSEQLRQKTNELKSFALKLLKENFPNGGYPARLVDRDGDISSSLPALHQETVRKIDLANYRYQFNVLLDDLKKPQASRESVVILRNRLSALNAEYDQNQKKYLKDIDRLRLSKLYQDIEILRTELHRKMTGAESAVTTTRKSRPIQAKTPPRNRFQPGFDTLSARIVPSAAEPIPQSLNGVADDPAHYARAYSEGSNPPYVVTSITPELSQEQPPTGPSITNDGGIQEVFNFSEIEGVRLNISSQNINNRVNYFVQIDGSSEAPVPVNGVNPQGHFAEPEAHGSNIRVFRFGENPERAPSGVIIVDTAASEGSPRVRVFERSGNVSPTVSVLDDGRVQVSSSQGQTTVFNVVNITPVPIGGPIVESERTVSLLGTGKFTIQLKHYPDDIYKISINHQSKVYEEELPKYDGPYNGLEIPADSLPSGLITIQVKNGTGQTLTTYFDSLLLKYVDSLEKGGAVYIAGRGYVAKISAGIPTPARLGGGGGGGGGGGDGGGVGGGGGGEAVKPSGNVSGSMTDGSAAVLGIDNIPNEPVTTVETIAEAQIGNTRITVVRSGQDLAFRRMDGQAEGTPFQHIIDGFQNLHIVNGIFSDEVRRLRGTNGEYLEFVGRTSSGETIYLWLLSHDAEVPVLIASIGERPRLQNGQIVVRLPNGEVSSVAVAGLRVVPIDAGEGEAIPRPLEDSRVLPAAPPPEMKQPMPEQNIPKAVIDALFGNEPESENPEDAMFAPPPSNFDTSAMVVVFGLAGAVGLSGYGEQEKKNRPQLNKRSEARVELDRRGFLGASAAFFSALALPSWIPLIGKAQERAARPGESTPQENLRVMREKLTGVRVAHERQQRTLSRTEQNNLRNEDWAEMPQSLADMEDITNRVITSQEATIPADRITHAPMPNLANATASEREKQARITEKINLIFSQQGLGVSLQGDKAFTANDWQQNFFQRLFDMFGITGTAHQLMFLDKFHANSAYLLRQMRSIQFDKDSDIRRFWRGDFTGMVSTDEWVMLNQSWMPQTRLQNVDLGTLMGMSITFTMIELARDMGPREEGANTFRGRAWQRDIVFEEFRASLNKEDGEGEQRDSIVGRNKQRYVDFTKMFNQQYENIFFHALPPEDRVSVIEKGGQIFASTLRRSGIYPNLNISPTDIIGLKGLGLTAFLPTMTAMMRTGLWPRGATIQTVASMRVNHQSGRLEAGILRAPFEKLAVALSVMRSKVEEVYQGRDDRLMEEIFTRWLRGEYDSHRAGGIRHVGAGELADMNYGQLPADATLLRSISIANENAQLPARETTEEAVTTAVSLKFGKLLYWTMYALQNNLLEIENPPAVGPATVRSSGITQLMNDMRGLLPISEALFNGSRKKFNLNDDQDMGTLVGIARNMRRSNMPIRIFKILLQLAMDPGLRTETLQVNQAATRNPFWTPERFNLRKSFAIGAVLGWIQNRLTGGLATTAGVAEVLRTELNVDAHRNRYLEWALRLKKIWTPERVRGEINQARLNQLNQELATQEPQEGETIMGFLLGEATGFKLSEMGWEGWAALRNNTIRFLEANRDLIAQDAFYVRYALQNQGRFPNAAQRLALLRPETLTPEMNRFINGLSQNASAQSWVIGWAQSLTQRGVAVEDLQNRPAQGVQPALQSSGRRMAEVIMNQGLPNVIARVNVFGRAFYIALGNERLHSDISENAQNFFRLSPVQQGGILGFVSGAAEYQGGWQAWATTQEDIVTYLRNTSGADLEEAIGRELQIYYNATGQWDATINPANVQGNAPNRFRTFLLNNPRARKIFEGSLPDIASQAANRSEVRKEEVERKTHETVLRYGLLGVFVSIFLTIIDGHGAYDLRGIRENKNQPNIELPHITGNVKPAKSQPVIPVIKPGPVNLNKKLQKQPEKLIPVAKEKSAIAETNEAQFAKLPLEEKRKIFFSDSKYRNVLSSVPAPETLPRLYPSDFQGQLLEQYKEAEPEIRDFLKLVGLLKTSNDNLPQPSDWFARYFRLISLFSNKIESPKQVATRLISLTPVSLKDFKEAGVKGEKDIVAYYGEAVEPWFNPDEWHEMQIEWERFWKTEKGENPTVPIKALLGDLFQRYAVDLRFDLDGVYGRDADQRRGYLDTIRWKERILMEFVEKLRKGDVAPGRLGGNETRESTWDFFFGRRSMGISPPTILSPYETSFFKYNQRYEAGRKDAIAALERDLPQHLRHLQVFGIVDPENDLNATRSDALYGPESDQYKKIFRQYQLTPKNANELNLMRMHEWAFGLKETGDMEQVSDLSNRLGKKNKVFLVEEFSKSILATLLRNPAYPALKEDILINASHDLISRKRAERLIREQWMLWESGAIERLYQKEYGEFTFRFINHHLLTESVDNNKILPGEKNPTPDVFVDHIARHVKWLLTPNEKGQFRIRRELAAMLMQPYMDFRENSEVAYVRRNLYIAFETFAWSVFINCPIAEVDAAWRDGVVNPEHVVSYVKMKSALRPSAEGLSRGLNLSVPDEAAVLSQLAREALIQNARTGIVTSKIYSFLFMIAEDKSAQKEFLPIFNMLTGENATEFEIHHADPEVRGAHLRALLMFAKRLTSSAEANRWKEWLKADTHQKQIRELTDLLTVAFKNDGSRESRPGERLQSAISVFERMLDALQQGQNRAQAVAEIRKSLTLVRDYKSAIANDSFLLAQALKGGPLEGPEYEKYRIRFLNSLPTSPSNQSWVTGRAQSLVQMGVDPKDLDQPNGGSAARAMVEVISRQGLSKIIEQVNLLNQNLYAALRRPEMYENISEENADFFRLAPEKQGEIMATVLDAAQYEGGWSRWMDSRKNIIGYVNTVQDAELEEDIRQALQIHYNITGKSNESINPEKVAGKQPDKFRVFILENPQAFRIFKASLPALVSRSEARQEPTVKQKKPSRREFIATTGALVAGAMIAGNAKAQAPQGRGGRQGRGVIQGAGEWLSDLPGLHAVAQAPQPVPLQLPAIPQAQNAPVFVDFQNRINLNRERRIALEALTGNQGQREIIAREALLLDQVIRSGNRTVDDQQFAAFMVQLDTGAANAMGLFMGWAEARMTMGWDATEGLVARLAAVLSNQDKRREIVRDVDVLLRLRRPGAPTIAGNLSEAVAKGMVISWAQFRISQSGDVEQSWRETSGVAAKVARILNTEIGANRNAASPYLSTVAKLYALSQGRTAAQIDAIPAQVTIADFVNDDEKWKFLMGFTISNAVDLEEPLLKPRSGAPNLSENEILQKHSASLLFLMRNLRGQLQDYYQRLGLPEELNPSVADASARRSVWGKFSSRLRMIEELLGTFDLTQADLRQVIERLNEVQQAAITHWTAQTEENISDQLIYYIYGLFYGVDVRKDLSGVEGLELEPGQQEVHPYSDMMTIDHFFRLMALSQRSRISAADGDPAIQSTRDGIFNMKEGILPALREFKNDPSKRPFWMTESDVDELILHIAGDPANGVEGLRNEHVTPGEAIQGVTFFLDHLQNQWPGIEAAEEELLRITRLEIFLQAVYMLHHRNEEGHPMRLDLADLSSWITLIRKGRFTAEEVAGFIRDDGAFERMERNMRRKIAQDKAWRDRLAARLGLTISDEDAAQIAQNVPLFDASGRLGFVTRLGHVVRMHNKYRGMSRRMIPQNWIESWFEDMFAIQTASFLKNNKLFIDPANLSYVVDRFREGVNELGTAQFWRLVSFFEGVGAEDISFQDLGEPANKLRRFLGTWTSIFHRMPTDEEIRTGLAAWNTLAERLRAANTPAPKVEAMQRELISRFHGMHSTLENTLLSQLYEIAPDDSLSKNFSPIQTLVKEMMSEHLISLQANLDEREQQKRELRERKRGEVAVLEPMRNQLARTRNARRGQLPAGRTEKAITDSLRERYRAFRLLNMDMNLPEDLSRGEYQFFIEQIKAVGYSEDEIFLRYIDLEVRAMRMYRRVHGVNGPDRVSAKQQKYFVSALAERIFTDWGFTVAEQRDAIAASALNKTVEQGITEELARTQRVLADSVRIRNKMRQFGVLVSYEKAYQMADNSSNSAVTVAQIENWIDLSQRIYNFINSRQVKGQNLRVSKQQILYLVDLWLKIGLSAVPQDPAIPGEEVYRQVVTRELRKFSPGLTNDQRRVNALIRQMRARRVLPAQIKRLVDEARAIQARVAAAKAENESRDASSDRNRSPQGDFDFNNIRMSEVDALALADLGSPVSDALDLVDLPEFEMRRAVFEEMTIRPANASIRYFLREELLKRVNEEIWQRPWGWLEKKRYELGTQYGIGNMHLLGYGQAAIAAGALFIMGRKALRHNFKHQSDPRLHITGRFFLFTWLNFSLAAGMVLLNLLSYNFTLSSASAVLFSTAATFYLFLIVPLIYILAVGFYFGVRIFYNAAAGIINIGKIRVWPSLLEPYNLITQDKIDSQAVSAPAKTPQGAPVSKNPKIDPQGLGEHFREGRLPPGFRPMVSVATPLQPDGKRFNAANGEADVQKWGYLNNVNEVFGNPELHPSDPKFKGAAWSMIEDSGFNPDLYYGVVLQIFPKDMSISEAEFKARIDNAIDFIQHRLNRLPDNVRRRVYVWVRPAKLTKPFTHFNVQHWLMKGEEDYNKIDPRYNPDPDFITPGSPRFMRREDVPMDPATGKPQAIDRMIPFKSADSTDPDVYDARFPGGVMGGDLNDPKQNDLRQIRERNIQSAANVEDRTNELHDLKVYDPGNSISFRSLLDLLAVAADPRNPEVVYIPSMEYDTPFATPESMIMNWFAQRMLSFTWFVQSWKNASLFVKAEKVETNFIIYVFKTFLRFVRNLFVTAFTGGPTRIHQDRPPGKYDILLNDKRVIRKNQDGTEEEVMVPSFYKKVVLGNLYQKRWPFSYQNGKASDERVTIKGEDYHMSVAAGGALLVAEVAGRVVKEKEDPMFNFPQKIGRLMGRWRLVFDQPEVVVMWVVPEIRNHPHSFAAKIGFGATLLILGVINVQTWALALSLLAIGTAITAIFLGAYFSSLAAVIKERGEALGQLNEELSPGHEAEAQMMRRGLFSDPVFLALLMIQMKNMIVQNGVQVLFPQLGLISFIGLMALFLLPKFLPAIRSFGNAWLSLVGSGNYVQKHGRVKGFFVGIIDSFLDFTYGVVEAVASPSIFLTLVVILSWSLFLQFPKVLHLVYFNIFGKHPPLVTWAYKNIYKIPEGDPIYTKSPSLLWVAANVGEGNPLFSTHLKIFRSPFSIFILSLWLMAPTVVPAVAVFISAPILMILTYLLTRGMAQYIKAREEVKKAVGKGKQVDAQLLSELGVAPKRQAAIIAAAAEVQNAKASVAAGVAGAADLEAAAGKKFARVNAPFTLEMRAWLFESRNFIMGTLVLYFGAGVLGPAFLSKDVIWLASTIVIGSFGFASGWSWLMGLGVQKHGTYIESGWVKWGVAVAGAIMIAVGIAATFYPLDFLGNTVVPLVASVAGLDGQTNVYMFSIQHQVRLPLPFVWFFTMIFTNQILFGAIGMVAGITHELLVRLGLFRAKKSPPPSTASPALIEAPPMKMPGFKLPKWGEDFKISFLKAEKNPGEFIQLLDGMDVALQAMASRATDPNDRAIASDVANAHQSILQVIREWTNGGDTMIASIPQFTLIDNQDLGAVIARLREVIDGLKQGARSEVRVNRRQALLMLAGLTAVTASGIYLATRSGKDEDLVPSGAREQLRNAQARYFVPGKGLRQITYVDGQGNHRNVLLPADWTDDIGNAFIGQGRDGHYTQPLTMAFWAHLLARQIKGDVAPTVNNPLTELEKLINFFDFMQSRYDAPVWLRLGSGSPVFYQRPIGIEDFDQYIAQLALTSGVLIQYRALLPENAPQRAQIQLMIESISRIIQANRSTFEKLYDPARGLLAGDYTVTPQQAAGQRLTPIKNRYKDRRTVEDRAALALIIALYASREDLSDRLPAWVNAQFRLTEAGHIQSWTGGFDQYAFNQLTGIENSRPEWQERYQRVVALYLQKMNESGGRIIFPGPHFSGEQYLSNRGLTELAEHRDIVEGSAVPAYLLMASQINDAALSVLQGLGGDVRNAQMGGLLYDSIQINANGQKIPTRRHSALLSGASALALVDSASAMNAFLNDSSAHGVPTLASRLDLLYSPANMQPANRRSEVRGIDWEKMRQKSDDLMNERQGYRYNANAAKAQDLIGGMVAMDLPGRSAREQELGRPIRDTTPVVSLFDPEKNNFNKIAEKSPLQVLGQGTLAGEEVRVHINYAPYVHPQFLIIPAPDENKPQVLDSDALNVALAVMVGDEALQQNANLANNVLSYVNFLQGQDVPHNLIFRKGDDILGFNSLGAGASVNHLHFHKWQEAAGSRLIDQTTEGESFVTGNGVKVSRIENYPVNGRKFQLGDLSVYVLARSREWNPKDENGQDKLLVSPPAIMEFTGRYNIPESKFSQPGLDQTIKTELATLSLGDDVIGSLDELKGIVGAGARSEVRRDTRGIDRKGELAERDKALEAALQSVAEFEQRGDLIKMLEKVRDITKFEERLLAKINESAILSDVKGIVIEYNKAQGRDLNFVLDILSQLPNDATVSVIADPATVEDLKMNDAVLAAFRSEKLFFGESVKSEVVKLKESLNITDQNISQTYVNGTLTDERDLAIIKLAQIRAAQLSNKTLLILGGPKLDSYEQITISEILRTIEAEMRSDARVKASA